MSQLQRGVHVKHKNGLVGKVVWDGNVANRGYLWGIELNDWNENGNDGSINGHHYFHCDPGHGLFSSEKNLTVIPAPKAKPPPADYDFAVGDFCSLRNGKEGTIMYIGPMGRSKAPVVGLKLRFWLETGHNGKGYFNVPDGYGYFAKIGAIASVKKKGGQSVLLPKKKKTPKKVVEESPAPLDLPAPAVECDVGDKIKLSRGRIGIVKWKGQLGSKLVIGVELEAWSEKGNDGTFTSGTKTMKLFDCQPGRGYFADAAKVAEVLVRGAGIKKTKPKKVEKAPEPVIEIDHSLIQVAIGDKVELRKGRVGYVRYIGEVKGLKGEIIGLELLQWDQKGHNGATADGTQYYTCKDGTGYWTSRQHVSVVLEKSGNQPVLAKKKKKPVQPPAEELKLDDIIDFALGDTVRLRKGREGVVKYYNPRNGIVGIELLQWSADAADGSYKGKEYFKCDKGRGYFTTAKNVKVVLKRAPRVDPLQAIPKKKQAPPPDPEPVKGASVQFKIGDHVRLGRGRTGTVRFIGTTSFMKDTIVGLELDEWSEKGNDGSFKGTRYFTTRGPGWGYFTKPSAIVAVIPSGAP